MLQSAPPARHAIPTPLILLAIGLLAPGCSDYKVSSGNDARAGDSASPGSDRPDDTPPGETGDPGDPDTGPPDFDDCEDGYYADYFNLPADHPDVELDDYSHGMGTVPSDHDWWDSQYFVRREIDSNLEFGSDWWPVDEGLPGDPQYYSVHWSAWLYMEEAGEVWFEMGSDDDSWAYIDGVLIAEMSGIHAVTETAFGVELAAGTHTLDLYMAERHTSGAGFWFRWTSADLDFYACE